MLEKLFIQLNIFYLKRDQDWICIADNLLQISWRNVLEPQVRRYGPRVQRKPYGKTGISVSNKQNRKLTRLLSLAKLFWVSMGVYLKQWTLQTRRQKKKILKIF